MGFNSAFEGLMAQIKGSNPTEGTDVRLLCLLCDE
jgi:hypothetical protein